MFTTRHKYANELEDFVCDVVAVMQYWLDAHTDPDTWAAMWLCDEDPSTVAKNYNGQISNNYFHFDWREAALETWCERSTTDFYKCGNCGCINENGMYCDYEDECADADDEEVSAKELADWIGDIYGDDIYELLSDWDWENALIKEGFEVYRDALYSLTCTIEEEVSDVLAALNGATSADELLLALTWALHTAHVHGNIIEDWADQAPGIETDSLYRTLCNVQQDGLLSTFEQSDIDDLFGSVTSNKDTDA